MEQSSGYLVSRPTIANSAGCPRRGRRGPRHRRWRRLSEQGGVSVLADKHDRSPPSRPKKVKADDATVGAALRKVYQDTVEESVPDEFSDLLGKLK